MLGQNDDFARVDGKPIEHDRLLIVAGLCQDTGSPNSTRSRFYRLANHRKDCGARDYPAHGVVAFGDIRQTSSRSRTRGTIEQRLAVAATVADTRAISTSGLWGVR